MHNKIIMLIMLLGSASMACAYEVNFIDSNTAVIEVGDPAGQTRAGGYFQIFGNAYENEFSNTGYDLSIMVYLSDASWSNWLDCYMDNQTDPTAESTILAFATTINNTKADSKITLSRQMDGSCHVALETVPGNQHAFPYDGFYVDPYMSNFRVNLPIEFSAPPLGYYVYTNGVQRVSLFANAVSGFHLGVQANGQTFQCQINLGNPMLHFALSTFANGGSPVAEYSVNANGSTCQGIMFRIGV